MEDQSYLQCLSLEGPTAATLHVLEACAADPTQLRDRLAKRGLLHFLTPADAAKPPTPNQTAVQQPAEFTVQLGANSARCLVILPDGPSPSSSSSSSSAVSVLLWLQPATLSETVTALAAACACKGVDLRPLDLRRLELRGPGALRTALRILRLDASATGPGPELWARAQAADVDTAAAPAPSAPAGPPTGSKRKRPRVPNPDPSPLLKVWKTVAPGVAVSLPSVLDPRALRDRDDCACERTSEGTAGGVAGPSSSAAKETSSLTELRGMMEGGTGGARPPPSTGARGALRSKRRQERMLLRPLSGPDAADTAVLRATFPLLVVKGFGASSKAALSLVVPAGWAAVLFLELVLAGVRPLGSREVAWVEEESK